MRNAVWLRLIGALWIAAALGWDGSALAQNQATQPYLMTVDACPLPGTSCSQGPSAGMVYLLQSADGVNWSLVPGFNAFEGSVAGLARRNDTIYIVTVSPDVDVPSAMQTVKYHMDTGIEDPPVVFSIQDSEFAGEFADPSLALNAEGQLVVIYDVLTLSGCPNGTCHIRMAIEVAGSDGTQFVAQPNDAVTYNVSSGGDPSAPFFDGTQWIIYAGDSPPPPSSTAELAFTSSTFAGPYTLYPGLPDGEISTAGLQVGGFFNTALAQYWDYLEASNFSCSPCNNIVQFVGTSLSQQITENTPTTLVVTNATLGTSNQNLQHPHFAVNWSGSQTIGAAVLPASRSATVGNPVTAFATMINTDIVNAADCYIAPLTAIPATFTYQTTNPSTNAVTGTANTPVGIAGNNGVQTFVFAVTPTAAFPPTNVQLTFGCASSTSATPISGVSTILLSGSATPVPDIVALAASGDPGIVDISSSSDAGAFAVATVNVGSSSQITASADLGGANLPVSLSLCQTNPTTGACLAPAGSSVTTTINANDTPTFAIFAGSSSTIPFDPANNRVFVRFTDSSGAERGATSVAVRTQ